MEVPCHVETVIDGQNSSMLGPYSITLDNEGNKIIAFFDSNKVVIVPRSDLGQTEANAGRLKYLIGDFFPISVWYSYKQDILFIANAKNNRIIMVPYRQFLELCEKEGTNCVDVSTCHVDVPVSFPKISAIYGTSESTLWITDVNSNYLTGLHFDTTTSTSEHPVEDSGSKKNTATTESSANNSGSYPNTSMEIDQNLSQHSYPSDVASTGQQYQNQQNLRQIQQYSPVSRVSIGGTPPSAYLAVPGLPEDARFTTPVSMADCFFPSWIKPRSDKKSTGLLIGQRHMVMLVEHVKVRNINLPLYVHSVVGSHLGFRDGDRKEALFRGSQYVAVDEQQYRIFICDNGNHVIRMLDCESETVTTIAGRVSTSLNGSFTGPGFADGPANMAKFRDPRAIIYENEVITVCDAGNDRVRKISTNPGELLPSEAPAEIVAVPLPVKYTEMLTSWKDLTNSQYLGPLVAPIYLTFEKGNSIIYATSSNGRISEVMNSNWQPHEFDPPFLPTSISISDGDLITINGYGTSLLRILALKNPSGSVFSSLSRSQSGFQGTLINHVYATHKLIPLRKYAISVTSSAYSGESFAICDQQSCQVVVFINDDVTVYGDGLPGHLDGRSTEARFNRPRLIIGSKDRVYYVVERFSIRMIANGTVSTIKQASAEPRGFILSAAALTIDRSPPPADNQSMSMQTREPQTNNNTTDVSRDPVPQREIQPIVPANSVLKMDGVRTFDTKVAFAVKGEVWVCNVDEGRSIQKVCDLEPDHDSRFLSLHQSEGSIFEIRQNSEMKTIYRVEIPLVSSPSDKMDVDAERMDPAAALGIHLEALTRKYLSAKDIVNLSMTNRLIYHRLRQAPEAFQIERPTIELMLSTTDPNILGPQVSSYNFKVAKSLRLSVTESLSKTFALVRTNEPGADRVQPDLIIRNLFKLMELVGATTDNIRKLIIDFDCNDLAFLKFLPNLETLKLTETVIPILPSRLTVAPMLNKLVLPNIEKPIPLDHFPPQITHLDIRSMRLEASSFPTEPYLSELRNLYISRAEIVPLARLPKSILELDMAYVTSITVGDAELYPFPPDLTSLNLAFSKLKDDFSYPLPTTLTELDIGGCKQLTASFVANSISPLFNLLRLDIKETSIFPEGLAFLPKSLTTLILPNPTLYQLSDEWIPHLPPNLVELDLSKSRNLSSAIFQHLPQSLTQLKFGILKMTSIHPLPPGLTYLDLSKCSNINLDAGKFLFRHLPKLTHLDISQAVELPLKITKYIPKTIRVLNLPLKIAIELKNSTMFWMTDFQLKSLRLPRNKLLSSACFMTLPRSLTVLELPESREIHQLDLFMLPRGLTVLDLAAATITPQGLQHLPHGLQTLNIRNSDIPDFSLFRRFGQLTELTLGTIKNNPLDAKLAADPAHGLPGSLKILSLPRCKDLTILDFPKRVFPHLLWLTSEGYTSSSVPSILKLAQNGKPDPNAPK